MVVLEAALGVCVDMCACGGKAVACCSRLSTQGQECMGLVGQSGKVLILIVACLLTGLTSGMACAMRNSALERPTHCKKALRALLGTRPDRR